MSSAIISGLIDSFSACKKASPINTSHLRDLRIWVNKVLEIAKACDGECIGLLLEKSNGLSLFLESTSGSLLEAGVLMCLRILEAVPKTIEELVLDYQRLVLAYVKVIFRLDLCVDDLSDWKLLSNILTGLDLAVQRCGLGEDFPLGDLLGICRHFMFCGLPKWDTFPVQSVFPQLQTLHEPDVGEYPHYTEISRDVRDASGKKFRRRKERPRLKRAVTGVSSASLAMPYRFTVLEETEKVRGETMPPSAVLVDSASDCERGEMGDQWRVQLLQTRVRQLALLLLYSVVGAVSKRRLLGFWPALSPDSTGARGRTLAAVLQRDNNARCRHLAAAVLQRMLSHSKPLLRCVDELSSRSLAFQPFSATLAALLRELHRYLTQTLLSERDTITRSAVLRALATLVSNTPYTQMRAGLLTKLSRHVRALLAARDTVTKCLAFDVLVAMISTRQQLAEVVELLSTPSALPPAVARLTHDTSAQSSTDEGDLVLSDLDCDEVEPVENVSNNACVSSSSWFWDRCRSFVLRRKSSGELFYPQQVRVQAMRATCLLCQSYLSVMAPCLAELARFLELCLQSDDEVIRLYGVRLLECVSAGAQDTATCSRAAVDVFSIWNELMTGSLPSLAHWDQSEAIRAGFCHAVSTMGCSVFERLSHPTQLLCITLVLPLASAQEPMVCSSAVRVLGVLVSMPSLRRHPDFVLHVASCACTGIGHQMSLVRENASWTLANLTDILSTSGAGEPRLITSCILTVLEAALKATADSDKVRVSGVRVMGNMLRYVPGHFLERDPDDEMSSLIAERLHEATAVLLSCMNPQGKSTHMKVAWNACYAYSNAMKNPAIHGELRQLAFLDALCCLCKECTNFKVRCNAAAALIAPSTRSFYGAKFTGVWSAVVESLQLAQNIENLSELKHREALLAQLCLAIIHLATLTELPDLTALADVLSQHWESVVSQMKRITTTLPPEDCETLIKATNHIRQLTPSDEQKLVLQLLEEVEKDPASIIPLVTT